MELPSALPVRTHLSSTTSLLCILLLLTQSLYDRPIYAERTVPQTQIGSPVPAQIAAAHKVFLTNAGADPNFPIDSTRVYNDVYAAIQAHGRYQLVGSPSEADLVFQLRDVAPITSVDGVHGSVSSYTSPAFQLTIVDPKTDIALWTITSPVNIAGKKSAYNRWVGIAETNLVSRIQVLAGQPLSSAETADLTTVPANHNLRLGLIVVGATLGAAAAGFLILHHLSDNALANQKASQDAFCKANNIPASECLGG